MYVREVGDCVCINELPMAEKELPTLVLYTIMPGQIPAMRSFCQIW